MFSPQIAFEFQSQREGLIKPQPIHLLNTNTGDKSTKSLEIKERDLKSTEEDSKVEPQYVLIDSVYQGGDKVKVLRSHLTRILKRRAARSKVSQGQAKACLARAKPDGPIHGSRSKFAKRRPRDHNGRFYTKAELEEMRRQSYIDTVVAYLESHPGLENSAE